MAIGWIAAFKAVPWIKVLNAAPAIVEGGRSLWTRVANRPGRRAAEEPASTQAESASEIEIRLRTLEKRTRQVEDEATASFDVVRSITEQHSHLAEQQAALVQATDALLARTHALLWVCALLALAVAAIFVLLLAR